MITNAENLIDVERVEEVYSDLQGTVEEVTGGPDSEHTQDAIVGLGYEVQVTVEEITDTEESIDGTTKDTNGNAVEDTTTRTAGEYTTNITEEDTSRTIPVDSKPSIISQPPPGYRSAEGPHETIPHIPGTLYVNVGAKHNVQQVWSLPKALLCQHSSYFADLIPTSNNNMDEATLEHFTPADFANFVGYMRSNIYSPSINNPPALPTHVEACLLGAHLGAPDYCEAAIRALHEILAPLAADTDSNVEDSPIQPDDVAYICK